MEVILLDKIQNLGELGECVNVKAGYARNFLIPQGKAARVTEENRAYFEEKRAALQAKIESELDAARTLAKKIEGLAVTIKANAGAEGKLFGSVGPRDIADAIIAAGSEVEKHHIQMPDGPIRHTGKHAVTVQLHNDVKCTVSVDVITDEAQEAVDLDAASADETSVETTDNASAGEEEQTDKS